VTVCGHVDHGKCVSGDTIIPLIDGTLITAKELFEKYYDKTKAKKIDSEIVQNISKKNIKLNSFENQKIISKPISHIWKRKSKTLIEIKTAAGDIIKTTPEHPYFTFSINGPKEKQAIELKEGEYIAIPKKIKIEDSNPKTEIINKLLQLDNFVCFLNKDFEIFNEKLKKYELKSLSKKLKISNLADSIKKQRFRIKDLFELGRFLKISNDKIYLCIQFIKNSNENQRVGHTSKKINLPNLNELEKLGYILGCIAGDGHLSKTQILLDNDDIEILETYQIYLKEIFNLNSKVKQNHTCKTVVNEGGLTFKRFLIEVIGFPEKEKSAKIDVPLIAQTNKEIFKGFFAGLLDTDGYVSKINNSIEITSKSEKLIQQCASLLLNFNINSTIFIKNNFYNLRISNKTYLKRFIDNFKPRLKRKLKRIIDASKKAQSSRIFDIIPLDKKILKELALPTKVNKKIPYFNKYLKSQRITSSFLRKVLENIKRKNPLSERLERILESDLNYVKIISKKEIKNKEKYVYDFTIPQTHNFIAERTLIHNTSILDCFRGSCVQTGEAGGITQKISFTKYPLDQLKKSCPLIEKSGIKLNIPGFLLIDTPGHAAFTNLRKRGGFLADLAVLVIDINEGIKPQTAEVIKILKHNKTPFLIALNKLDNISGFRENKTKPLKESIESQSQNVKQVFDERYMTLIGSLNAFGFDADLYYNIQDFTKKIALIPCSAKTKEGIQELIMMLCGLSQKYLAKKLELNKDAKGIILEIKKEKSTPYAEAILYDGELSRTDQIAIANFNGEPTITKIRILEEIEPLCAKFKPKEKVRASTGLRMQLIEKKDILPGMPFEIYKNNLEEIKTKFKKEISENIKTDKQGIIAKADSLGSLEALMTLLKEKRIPVVKAGIGSINKTDIISAKANIKINELDALIIGFNVSIEEDAKEIQGHTKIILNEVIYRLIDDLIEFRETKSKEIEKQRLMELATICKVEILPQYIFRNSNPAVFGVKILGGKIRNGLNLNNDQGEKVGRLKNIQSENKSIDEATENMEVAISIPGVNFERQLNETKFLYSEISSSQFKTFKKNKDLLSENEKKILQEIAVIRRQKNEEWGV